MQQLRHIPRLRPRGPNTRIAIGYGVASAGIALTTGVLSPARECLGLLNIGLLFLLLVVLVSVRWGWGPGLFASVAANLALNYSFVPPLYTFTVQEPSNVLALGAFLGGYRPGRSLTV